MTDITTTKQIETRWAEQGSPEPWQRFDLAEAEVARLRAHIAATCRMCNGTGIRGGSGGTNPPRAEIWPCDHGLSALTAPADPQPRRASHSINPDEGFATAGAEARWIADTAAGVYDDPQPDAHNAAIRDVIAERQRQISEEGWTPEHDDQHDMGQMASAAACYAAFTEAFPEGDPPRFWPWSVRWWKPTNRRRNLVKSGALILAEIERLDRAALLRPEGGE